MFRQYYNLTQNPFSKAIPIKDAFTTHDFAQMRTRLDFLAKTGGIGMFCAGSGYGKTFAMRTWARELNRNTTNHAYICLSTVSTGEFYRQLCHALGVDARYKKSDMFKAIQEHLIYQSVEKRMQTIITIDEAQYLSNDILRDLKMITNFEMDSRDCVGIALVGQPVLADVLSRGIHEALRQRIVVNYTFEGLKEAEVKDYVDSLLRSAGASPDIIDASALLAAFGCCQGSIRKLNTLLTNALRIGAQTQAAAINTDMMLAANEETAIR